MRSALPLPAARRGVTIMEMVIALGLLLIVFATLPPVLTAVDRMEQAQTERQVALHEVAAIQQRILTAAAAGEASDDVLAELVTVREAIRATLPDAVAEFVRSDLRDSEWTQVDVSLRWGRQSPRTVTLATLLPPRRSVASRLDAEPTADEQTSDDGRAADEGAVDEGEGTP